MGCSAGPAWLTKQEYAELTSFAVGSQCWTYRGGKGGLMSCTYLDAGAAAGQVLPGGSCCQVSVVRVPTSPP